MTPNPIHATRYAILILLLTLFDSKSHLYWSMPHDRKGRKHMISLEDIRKAQQLLAGNAVRTPLLRSAKLSEITGAEIHVKFENMQVTNSFKDRGAFVKLSSLTDQEKARGVIAMSAGNHAQAV